MRPWSRLAIVFTVAVPLLCIASAVMLQDPSRWFLASPSWSASWAAHLNFLGGIYPEHPQFALIIAGLFALGMMLAIATFDVRYAWGEVAGRRQLSRHNLPIRSDATRQNRSLVQRTRTGLFILLGANVCLWVCLWLGWYTPLFLTLWIAGLLGVAVLWGQLAETGDLQGRWFFTRREAVGLGVLCSVFLLYVTPLSTSWRYSWAGDEFIYFTLAKRMALGEMFNAFSPHGAYDYHPVLGSLWVAWFMRGFGQTVLAWRLSSVVAVALAIPALYLFVREIVGQRAAVVATVLFAANHFVITFALKGFNNGQAFAPMLWALALWCVGVRWRSDTAMYLAGVVSGLGFYTYYTARLTVGFVGLGFLFAIAWCDGREIRRWVQAYAVGIILTVTPLLVSGTNFIGSMLNETSMGNQTIAPQEWPGALWNALFGSYARIKWQWTILEPLYTPRIERFVYGSYLDTYTASLSLVGIGCAALRGRRGSVLWWLLACTLGIMLIAGVLAKYQVPPATRMIVVVPFYALFTGFAVQLLSAKWSANRFGHGCAIAFVVAVLTVSIVANQYRLLVTVPSLDTVDPHALIVQLAQTSAADRHFYYVVPDPYRADPELLLAEIYDYAKRAHWLRSSALEKHTEAIELPATFVFTRIYERPLDALIDVVRTRYPRHRERVLRGVGGSEVVAIDVDAR